MNLVIYEFKKILKNKFVIYTLFIILAINIFIVLFGSTSGHFKANEPTIGTNFKRLKEEGEYFKGDIDENWIDNYNKKLEEFLNNKENLILESEKEQTKKHYLEEGFTEEEINSLGNIIYLNEKGKDFFSRFEEYNFYSDYFNKAKNYSNKLKEYYRQKYTEEKFKIFEKKIDELYNNFLNNYEAKYNYDNGYWKFRIMHNFYPYTLGLAIIVSLSSLFSIEFSSNLEAIVLSTKYGKRRLVFAKAIAGFLFVSLLWLIFEFINIIIIFSFFSFTGAESLWPNFLLDNAPYLFNQAQISIITSITTYFGMILFFSITMLISACSKKVFNSVLISSLVLFIPIFISAAINNNIIDILYKFCPAYIISGIPLWQNLDLVYFAEQAIEIKYFIAIISLFIMFLSLIITYNKFSKHQVS